MRFAIACLAAIESVVAVPLAETMADYNHYENEQMWFNKVDSNKDGFISFEEFVDEYYPEFEEAPEWTHEQFEFFDLNADGLISWDEHWTHMNGYDQIDEWKAPEDATMEYYATPAPDMTEEFSYPGYECWSTGDSNICEQDPWTGYGCYTDEEYEADHGYPHCEEWSYWGYDDDYWTDNWMDYGMYSDSSYSTENFDYPGYECEDMGTYFNCENEMWAGQQCYMDSYWGAWCQYWDYVGDYDYMMEPYYYDGEFSYPGYECTEVDYLWNCENDMWVGQDCYNASWGPACYWWDYVGDDDFVMEPYYYDGEFSYPGYECTENNGSITCENDYWIGTDCYDWYGNSYCYDWQYLYSQDSYTSDDFSYPGYECTDVDGQWNCENEMWAGQDCFDGSWGPACSYWDYIGDDDFVMDASYTSDDFSYPGYECAMDENYQWNCSNDMWVGEDCYNASWGPACYYWDYVGDYDYMMEPYYTSDDFSYPGYECTEVDGYWNCENEMWAGQDCYYASWGPACYWWDYVGDDYMMDSASYDGEFSYPGYECTEVDGQWNCSNDTWAGEDCYNASWGPACEEWSFVA